MREIDVVRLLMVIGVAERMSADAERMLDNERPRLLLTAEASLGALVVALIEIGTLIEQIAYLVELRCNADCAPQGR